MSKIKINGVVGRTDFYDEVNMFRFQVLVDYGESVAWYDCKRFGKADVKKGDTVEVDGELRLVKWLDNENVEHTSKQIIVEHVKVI